MDEFQANENVSTKAIWMLSLCSLVRNLMGFDGKERTVCFSEMVGYYNIYKGLILKQKIKNV